jgi:hypothetical protein
MKYAYFYYCQISTLQEHFNHLSTICNKFYNSAKWLFYQILYLLLQRGKYKYIKTKKNLFETIQHYMFLHIFALAKPTMG